jgi:diguanylate cyclase (GGDEF)-like protein
MAPMPDESLKQEPAESALDAAERKPTGRFSAAERLPEAQTISDLDQSLADGDQTGGDFDQTAADADETASERDQLAADRDQVAADDDRAAALDHGLAPEDGEGYARSRRARSKSARDRESASRVRAQTALARDDAATRRDRLAAQRDAAARTRDELAAKVDAEFDRLEHEDGAGDQQSADGADALRRARDRRRAGLSRSRAAALRDIAAKDRELAAKDRADAARDRAGAAAELAAEGLDDLTGTMRRRVGFAAIQREIDRTRRSGESLVVAYVDVDGLKVINDTAGHRAGDELLTAVARSIMHHLRSYDVICRFGGDEFVCSLAGQDLDGARERFQQIGTRLSEASSGATISVGFAERGEDDTLEGLIGRADSALIGSRNRRPEA